MGCKLYISSVAVSLDNGINRYIVGCKCILKYLCRIINIGINRYIVGCKFVYDANGGTVTSELIDT